MDTPEGLRRDARITVLLSIVLVGLCALNLAEGTATLGPVVIREKGMVCASRAMARARRVAA